MSARFERALPKGEDAIGFQAQCNGCDWNSILHNHQQYAVEDARIHHKYFHHEVVTWPVKA